MQGPTTISLHPIPRGATVLTEGAPHRYLYRVEGGRVAARAKEADLFEVGPGAIFGATGIVLGAPQLFTVTGCDRGTSFAKKYPAADLAEFLMGNEPLFSSVHASIEMESVHVEKALIEKELLKDADEARREGRIQNALNGLAAEIAALSAEIALVDGSAMAGELLARGLSVTFPDMRALFLMMRERALLRALARGREVHGIATGDARRSCMAEVLKASARRVADAAADL